jgi:hypothetical protein
VGIYLLLHSPFGYTGYEYTQLSAAQVQQTGLILRHNETADMQNPEPVAAPRIDTPFTITDSTLIDTYEIKAEAPAPVKREEKSKAKCDSCATGKALLFLRTELGDKIDEADMLGLQHTMRSLSPDEMARYLADKPIKVKAYFWFCGPVMYLEALFWTIIGALCSIMFAIAVDIRNYPGKRNAKYYTSKIPYDVAKLFYAPFITVVIMLAYNFIRFRNISEVNTTQGMLVLSFLTGLFAGRIMGAAENIKEVLFPDRRQHYKDYDDNKYYEARSLPTPDAKYDDLNTHSYRDEPVAKVPAPKAEVAADIKNVPDEKRNTPEKIRWVGVFLNLDAEGLFEDEQAAILDSGLDKAMVTLHQVNGKEIYPLLCEEDGHEYGMAHVNPGIYIVRATLSIMINNNYMMNLFGEKTIFITSDNNRIELYIRKYEALD